MILRRKDERMTGARGLTVMTGLHQTLALQSGPGAVRYDRDTYGACKPATVAAVQHHRDEQFGPVDIVARGASTLPAAGSSLRIGYVTGGLAQWQLKRVQDAMEDRLECSVSLVELAAVAGLSPCHLSRAFKVSTGLSPMRWLSKRRIERAKELLRDPTLSLTIIAQMVGYTGQGPFGEAFRREVGLPPGQYRRQSRP